MLVLHFYLGIAFYVVGATAWQPCRDHDLPLNISLPSHTYALAPGVVPDFGYPSVP